MDAPLVMHLKPWSATRAVEARNAVRDLAGHPGWAFFTEALELREKQLVDALLSTSPSDEGAEYAAQAAEINALRSVPGIVDGVLERGRQAESELREQELVAA